MKGEGGEGGGSYRSYDYCKGSPDGFLIVNNHDAEIFRTSTMMTFSLHEDQIAKQA